MKYIKELVRILNEQTALNINYYTPNVEEFKEETIIIARHEIVETIPVSCGKLIYTVDLKFVAISNTQLDFQDSELQLDTIDTIMINSIENSEVLDKNISMVQQLDRDSTGLTQQGKFKAEINYRIIL